MDMEINGNARQVERIRLSSKALERPLPKLKVAPQRDPSSPVWPRVNPEYARRLIPVVLRAVEDYAQKLKLPVPERLTTNHVARFKLEEDRNSPYATLELTNGWRFLYCDTMVNGFYAPDNLFNSDSRPILLKEFAGEWRLTEKQAVELVRRTLAKLAYPTNLVHFEVEPQVQKPAVAGIPRFMFRWNYSVEGEDVLRSAISAEVDADKGELKSLYYGDMAFNNRGPKIDVPIMLPAATPPPTSPFALPTSQGSPQRPIPNAVPPR